MRVEVRCVGRRRAVVPEWSVPGEPPTAPNDGGGCTLRELVARIVREEVAGFEERERARRFLRVLSDRDLEQGARAGKWDPDARGGAPQRVDVDSAIASAWQAFEDGLYLVILDGVEQRDLERQVFVNDDSHVLFLRLTFLAGA